MLFELLLKVPEITGISIESLNKKIIYLKKIMCRDITEIKLWPNYLELDLESDIIKRIKFLNYKKIIYDSYSLKNLFNTPLEIFTRDIAKSDMKEYLQNHF